MNKKNPDKPKFKWLYYIWKNLFSSETIYFFIHTIITSGVLCLSTIMILNKYGIEKFIIAFVIAGTAFIFLSCKYFYECIKIYRVLVDGTDESFNHTFSMAWFLHFYV